MSLTDEYSFRAQAGRGGDGVVRWRREKFLPRGGPNGGDGGKGGDVYIRAIRDIMVLGRISHKDSYAAENGSPGADSSKTGAGGNDLFIDLPLGSVVTNTATSATYELLAEGETHKVLAGGAGGFGNEHFKSSTNQTPMQATKGAEGEQGAFTVELKLIADVGLIGLPNAGKTSLLNALTNAGARVGAYPFTTLDPNLGAYFGYILADIPGIIEGASQGKGLGHKFLRHVSRTKLIIHCISVERDTMADDYRVIRQEISSVPDIANKTELLLPTKSDTVSETELRDRLSLLKEATSSQILEPVSIIDDASLKRLADTLVVRLRGDSDDVHNCS